jgi:S1-C subfamily serine protease
MKKLKIQKWMALASVALLSAGAAALLSEGAQEPAKAASSGVLKQLSDDLADVVSRVLPSVVVVQTETTTVPMYYDLFFRPIPGQPYKHAGQGSGVIIDAEGHVLTSRHVIENADVIKVVLDDGTVFDAERVGEDRYTDIGVVRIKNPGDVKVVPIEVGDSDALRVGELVVAVGSPFSLSGSVSMGIVSQKHRTIGKLPYEDLIQTDASINPGNSGGPLVDLEGRLVGINAIIQTAGPLGSIGIGFAVPSNRSVAIAETLIAGRRVERPWLGIWPRDMNRRAAERFIGTPGGVYVAEVFRNTPAYRSGVYKGDIILAVDEAQVTSVIELQREVFQNEIGEPVKLKVLRNNRALELDIKTELMPDRSMFK